MQPTQSPLDQLADIHLPDAISWWPLAPGWWALAALLILAFIALGLWRSQAKKNRYRQLALQELDAIYNHYQTTHNATDFLHGISVLLRRTALTSHPNSFNASIKGQSWLNWLDSVCPTDKKNPHFLFNSTCGEQLLMASYQKNPEIDATALYNLCRHWLAQHRNHHQKLPKQKPLPVAVEAPHV